MVLSKLMLIFLVGMDTQQVLTVHFVDNFDKIKSEN